IAAPSKAWHFKKSGGSKDLGPASNNPTSSNLLSDETFDDSALEPVFNEQTCRRHMKVSRSGRFKEKRRVTEGMPNEISNHFVSINHKSKIKTDNGEACEHL
uniref:Uncharacterized protein n=1 Tax=Oryzias sinensis TaxID=183150 RepID=A0A8C7XUS4_9TELE